MPYAPYRRGPVAVVVCALIALAALVLGLVDVSQHPVRGGIFLAAAAAAALLAALARRR